MIRIEFFKALLDYGVEKDWSGTGLEEKETWEDVHIITQAADDSCRALGNGSWIKKLDTFEKHLPGVIDRAWEFVECQIVSKKEEFLWAPKFLTWISGYHSTESETKPKKI